MSKNQCKGRHLVPACCGLQIPSLPLLPELNSVIEAFIIKMAASIPVHTDETFALLAFDNESSRVKRSFSSSSHISSPWGSGRAAAGEL